MKRIFLILTVLLFTTHGYAAKQTINNGETMGQARTKINANFTEVYTQMLVGDCTVGPCFDGSTDGGNYLRFWAGTGSYWTSLQGGAPAANRSWRLPTNAPPSAGETNVMTMDENGQMNFLDKPGTTGYILSSTDAGVLSWVAPGSGSMTYPSSGNFGYTSNGTTWASMGLDTDISSTSANDDTVPSAKSVKAAIDGLPLLIIGSGLTVEPDTPSVGESRITVTNPVEQETYGSGWENDPKGASKSDLYAYLSTLSVGSGSNLYVSTVPTYSDSLCTPGQYALDESYRYDCVASGNWNRTSLTNWTNAAPVAPVLNTATISSAGTSLTLAGDRSLSVGAGGSGGFDVDCTTAGSNIAATYSSGAPGTSLVYTLASTVNSGDSCDLDYTQPGNGIEATTGGGDLASITSKAIVNDSTAGSACPSGTYLIAWDGNHSSSVDHACNGSGTALDGTQTGSIQISSSYGEGGADVGLRADAVNEYITWSDSGGTLVDLNGAQTVWVRMYVSATPTNDTRIFEAWYDASNFLRITVKASREIVGLHAAGSTQATAYSVPVIPSGSWVDVAYSWDRPNRDHSTNVSGTWDDDNDELSSTDGTDVTSIMLGSYSMFYMGTGEGLQITKMAVVSGYKASKPW